MKYKISVISGDGIGPEITKCSIDVIKAIENKLDIEFELLEIEAGDSALRNNGMQWLDNSSIVTDYFNTLQERLEAELEEVHNMYPNIETRYL